MPFSLELGYNPPSVRIGTGMVPAGEDPPAEQPGSEAASQTPKQAYEHGHR